MGRRKITGFILLFCVIAFIKFDQSLHVVYGQDEIPTTIEATTMVFEQPGSATALSEKNGENFIPTALPSIIASFTEINNSSSPTELLDTPIDFPETVEAVSPQTNPTEPDESSFTQNATTEETQNTLTINLTPEMEACASVVVEDTPQGVECEGFTPTVTITPTPPVEEMTTQDLTIEETQITPTPTLTPTTGECISGDITGTPHDIDCPTVTLTETETPTIPIEEATFTVETEPVGQVYTRPASDISDAVCTLEPTQIPVKNNLIIKFTPEGFSSFQSTGLFTGLPTISIDQLDSVVVSVTQDEADALEQSLSTNSDVLYIEPDSEIVSLDLLPNDPEVANQTYLDNINAFSGWNLNTGLSSTVIAIIDTGVDLDHPDLVGKLLQGIDLVDNTYNPQDDNGHGTQVAGIAAAESNNDLGIAGIDWNAMILPVKVLNSAGSGTYATAAEGIIWAVDHGSNIINLSFGGTKKDGSSVLQDAVNYAAAHNVLVVAASGNNSSDQILYPAAFNSVLAVGATDDQDQYATFSNYGPELGVSAPGVNIYSTALGGNYTIGSGTSFSAPQVSGLAAILCGIIPSCPIDQVKAAIINSSLDLGTPGWDPYYGSGLIQMDAAIQYAIDHITPTSMYTFTPSPTNMTIPTFTLTYTPTIMHFGNPTPTEKIPLDKTPQQTSTPTLISISQTKGSISPEVTLPAPTSNPNSEVSIAKGDKSVTLSPGMNGSPLKTQINGNSQNLKNDHPSESIFIIVLMLVLLSALVFFIKLFFKKKNLN